MTILSNSKIVLSNVRGFSVNKRDTFYMPTKFLERGWVSKQCTNSKTSMETHVFMQVTIFVMHCLNKKKFFVSLSTLCDIILVLVHIKQNCKYHFFLKIKILW